MRKQNNYKIIVLIIAAVLSILFLCGCVSAEANIGSDGSGIVTLTIAKQSTTITQIQERFSTISTGVDAMSSAEKRLHLKSITESDTHFIVQVKFARIQDIKGLGDFDYKSSKDYLGELSKTTKLAGSWASGRYGTLQVYTQDIFELNERNEDYAILPQYVSTGEQFSSKDFVAQDGIMSRSKNGMIFTYFIAGFDGLKSIRFSLNGKIIVYAGKNLEVVEDNQFLVTPIQMQAVVTTAGDEPQIIKKTINVFAGYVYFEHNPNYGLIIGLSISGIAIAGFIVWGIKSRRFQKILRSKQIQLVQKNYDLYLMILPAFILIGIFSYLPMAGIILAFKNFNLDYGIFASEWTGSFGFQNFIELLTKPNANFWLLLKNTVLLAGLRFIFGFTCAISLAILFSYLKKGLFKNAVQTFSYFPYFISWVVISGIAYLFLSADSGVLNKMISLFGKDPVTWYSQPQYWRGILTFTSLWKTTGYATIVYIAGMTSIDPHLYEAAKIDGGGRLRQLWHITLPGLSTIIGIQLVFSLGNLVRDDLDQILSLTGGTAALHDVTQVISTVVFSAVGSPEAYSSAAAMDLLLGMISLALVISANKIVKKMGLEGAY